LRAHTAPGVWFLVVTIRKSEHSDHERERQPGRDAKTATTCADPWTPDRAAKVFFERATEGTVTETASNHPKDGNGTMSLVEPIRTQQQDKTLMVIAIDIVIAIDAVHAALVAYQFDGMIGLCLG
jgi:hypothetical protein